MLYNWAAEHPDCVQCIGGIYTVCDQSSWPRPGQVGSAYHMSRGRAGEAFDRAQSHRPAGAAGPGEDSDSASARRRGHAGAVGSQQRRADAPLPRPGWRRRNWSSSRARGTRSVPNFFQNRRLLDFFPATGEASGRAASRRRKRKCSRCSCASQPRRASAPFQLR